MVDTIICQTTKDGLSLYSWTRKRPPICLVVLCRWLQGPVILGHQPWHFQNSGSAIHGTFSTTNPFNFFQTGLSLYCLYCLYFLHYYYYLCYRSCGYCGLRRCHLHSFQIFAVFIFNYPNVSSRIIDYVSLSNLS